MASSTSWPQWPRKHLSIGYTDHLRVIGALPCLALHLQSGIVPGTQPAMINRPIYDQLPKCSNLSLMSWGSCIKQEFPTCRRKRQNQPS
jgi:hypothetical protein